MKRQWYDIMKITEKSIAGQKMKQVSGDTIYFTDSSNSAAKLLHVSNEKQIIILRRELNAIKEILTAFSESATSKGEGDMSNDFFIRFENKIDEVNQKVNDIKSDTVALQTETKIRFEQIAKILDKLDNKMENTVTKDDLKTNIEKGRFTTNLVLTIISSLAAIVAAVAACIPLIN